MVQTYDGKRINKKTNFIEATSANLVCPSTVKQEKKKSFEDGL